MKITKGILLLIATAVFFAMQAWSQTTVINENIQSWTARSSYGTYTQTISAGTVNMVQCIVQPSASASGTGSVGRVQLQGTNGILALPQVSSVSVAEFRIAASGASRSVKLQEYNGSTWVDVTTFSGIGTTGATYTHTLNNSSSTQLRLASPSSAIYVHDIIIKDYAVASPTIEVTPTSLSGFTYIVGNGPSTAQTFTVSGSNLTANISLTAPANYEISLSSGSGYVASINLPQSGGSVANTTIYVRLKAGLSAANYNGETISASSTGATNKTVTCNGTVTTPTITVSATALTGFAYNLGNGPSTSQNFTVSGSSLTANIGLAAPTNYEISLSSGSGYATSLTLTQSGGSVSTTTIYVRLKQGLPIANYNDELINITSTGATSKTVECDGEVVCGTPTAPVATDASNIDEDSFTANWNAVSGAGGYYLDVYTLESGGTASDLFISEYVEGSSNNKYIEIFNGTGSSVDLSDYRLRLYANGSSSTPSDIKLSGTLANNETIVYKNSSATIYSGTASTNVAVNFNGNDAVALYKISTSSNVDIFGRIGEDPGTAWTSGSHTTVDKTLVRKSVVASGITTNPASGFPTLASEWDYYNTDDVSHLGGHSFSGGGTPDYILENENVGNVNTYTVTGLNPATTYFYIIRSYNSCGNTSSNSNTIEITTDVLTNAHDGQGIASVYNGSSGGLNGYNIWQRAKTNQIITLEITGEETDYLANVSVELPAGYTGLLSSNVSLLGDAVVVGTSLGVSGNTITIHGLELSSAKSLMIRISGITTPANSTVTDNGIHSLTVKTSIEGGSLTTISGLPTMYSTIPMSNVKDYNSGTYALNKLNQTVVVEGITTVASGRLSSGSYDQFFIQEGEGTQGKGLAIRSDNAFNPVVDLSGYYVIKGQIKLVRGASDDKTDVRANMTAISEPQEIIFLNDTLLPEPYLTSIENLHAMSVADFEEVDGVLMRLHDAAKSSGTWPASNSSFANIYIKDASGTNTLRCYIFANTDIGGNPEPAWPTSMVTLVYNYDEDGDDNYDGTAERQITPIYYDNFYKKIVWDGSTGNTLWSDPQNWSPNLLPQSVDDVVFDNITGPAGNYTVILDSRHQAFVKSVTIKPNEGNQITLDIPESNTNIPALDISAGSSGITIHSGGVFINNSGANSGDPVTWHSSGGVYPDFTILNGGKYVHNTLRSTANMTERLSSAVGTEDGTFKIDLNSASANFQISASGKTFGNLEFSATYGAKNYAISGPSAITIRGDLIVNSNVSINEVWPSETKFNNEIIVGGDFIFSGSGWNINTENPANQIRFNGNSVQIISDNTGALSSAGGFGKNIIINNPSGVSLGNNLALNNTLSLLSGNIILGNYKLTINNTLSYGAGLIEGSSNSSLRLSGTQPVSMNFKVPAMLGTLELDKTGMNIPLTTNLSISDSLKFNGGIISTGTNAILFGDNAGCSGAGTTSFINGNVSKSGSQTFAFPTGNVTTRDIGNGLQTYSVFAPISLTPVNGSSTSTVAYLFTEPPYDWWPHGENMDETMVWVSSREYWNVSTTGDISTVILVWSENDHNEGETCIHDICPNGIPAQFNTANLTVTAFYNNRWRDLGVATASGNHEAGSITSLMGLPTGSKAGNYIVSFGSLNKDVTLPVEWLSLQAENIFEDIELEWRTASETNNSGFVVEHAGSDFQFSSIGFIKGSGNSSDVNAYQFLHNKPGNGVHYYRLKQLDFDGNYQYSGIVSAQLKSYSENLMTDFYINSNGIMYISGKTSTNNPMDISVFDTYGRMIEKHNIQANNFRFETSVNVGSYKAGMYYYSITDGMNILTEKFVITE